MHCQCLRWTIEDLRLAARQKRLLFRLTKKLTLLENFLLRSFVFGPHPVAEKVEGWRSELLLFLFDLPHLGGIGGLH